MPIGLTDPNTGIISGTPSAPGTFNYTIQVKDNSGAIASTIGTIQVTQIAGLLTITSPDSSHSAVVGQPFNFQLTNAKYSTLLLRHCGSRLPWGSHPIKSRGNHWVPTAEAANASFTARGHRRGSGRTKRNQTNEFNRSPGEPTPSGVLGHFRPVDSKCERHIRFDMHGRRIPNKRP